MSAVEQRRSVYIKEKPGLTAKISNLRVEYFKLASKYQGLALLLRRDVQLDNAFERFHCAALFQHLPAAFGKSGDGTEGGVHLQLDHALATDEICPVSRGWYTRLVNASEALATWPDNEYHGSDLSTIQGHILWAEISLYYAERLLDGILSQLPLSYQAINPVAMIRSWNRFCEGAKADLAEEAVIKAAKNEAALAATIEYPKRPDAIFARTWFASEHILQKDLPPAVWLEKVRKSSMPPPEGPKAALTSSASQGSQGIGAHPGPSSAGAQPSPAPPGSEFRGYDSAHPFFNPYGFASAPPPPTPQDYYPPSAGFGFQPTAEDELPRAQNTPFDGYFKRPSFYPSFNESSQGFSETYGTRRCGRRSNAGQSSSSPPPPRRRYSSGPCFTDPPRGDPNPATTGNHFVTQIERLKKYNDLWDALQPSDSYRTIPYPSRGMNLTTLEERSRHGLAQPMVTHWTAEDHIKVNAARFWAEGCGVALGMHAGRKAAEIGPANSVDKVKGLRKQLRMKEASRWHPDTLNRRTGREEGGTDESIGKRKEMNAIWGALQDLLDQCERF